MACAPDWWTAALKSQYRHCGRNVSGSLPAQSDSRYLAVLHNILLADNDQITVINADGVHAVTAHTQRKVFCATVEIGERIALDVLLGIDRRTGRDTAKNRDTLQVREVTRDSGVRKFCLSVS